MKICTIVYVKKWLFAKEAKLLPFNGNWFTAVLVDDNNNLLSYLNKHDDSIIIEHYGLEINCEKFQSLLNVPNVTILDLIKESSNVVKISTDEYKIAKLAKKEKLIYGFVSYNCNYYYFVFKKSFNFSFNPSTMIDPNNPFI